MLKKIINKKNILLLLDILLLIIVIIYGKKVYTIEIYKVKFTKQIEQFSQENKNPIFKISKVILYNSANAVDSSEGMLEDIRISQFTDIAIYIDNKCKTEELTAENTISEIYLNNIKLNMNSSKYNYIFNYKNPKKFGKYSLIDNYENDNIIMNVIKTNNEMTNIDFDNNIFYTDCSNPISLGLINKDFITNGKVMDANGQFKFDGSILGNARVNLEDLSGKIEFFINITNNLGEKFICSFNIENDLTKNKEDLFGGYSIEIKDLEGDKYNFLKVLNN